MICSIQELNEPIVFSAEGNIKLQNTSPETFNRIKLHKSHNIINRAELTYAGKDLSNRLKKILPD